MSKKKSSRSIFKIIIVIIFFLLLSLDLFKTIKELFKAIKEESHVVSGNSMIPTLQPFDYITCNTFLTIGEKKLHHGDIIVFYNSKNLKRELSLKDFFKSTDHIKRIIALPGDEIMIKNGNLFLNNKLKFEEYINEPNSTFNVKDGFTKEGKKYVVPKRHVFVLGDNRERSFDSRFYGYISIEDVKCVLPWEKQDKYKKRWKKINKSELINNLNSNYENNSENNEFNDNLKISPTKVPLPKIDLNYVSNTLDMAKFTRENWLSVAKGKISDEELNNFINSLNILIDFCNTLLSRLAPTKTPTNDDIFMYNSIIKLRNETVSESRRLVEKYSLKTVKK